MTRDILTPDELVELTSKKHSAAQRKELAYLEIPFRPRLDGTLVVARKDIPMLRDTKSDTVKLNLDAIT